MHPKRGGAFADNGVLFLRLLSPLVRRHTAKVPKLLNSNSFRKLAGVFGLTKEAHLTLISGAIHGNLLSVAEFSLLESSRTRIVIYSWSDIAGFVA
jgi:hypothetical protein